MKHSKPVILLLTVLLAAIAVDIDPHRKPKGDITLGRRQYIE